MRKPEPIFVTDRNAAHMLDMSKAEFLDLVHVGALPQSIPIGPKAHRWSVKDLMAIQSGESYEDPVW